MQKLLFLAFSLLLLGCNKNKIDNPEFYQLVNQYDGQFDCWIKNGQILNGIDTMPLQADIIIKEDQIIYIGKVDSTVFKAQQQIDAQGALVTPGFIDAHAHGDPMDTPDFSNFLAMGVTSIALGQDGFSPQVENIQDWFEKVDSTAPSVNIIPFVGHSTLRLLSGVNYEPNPAQEYIEKMYALLNDAMKNGCFGMTTGLEYNPGQYAEEEELLSLAKIVGQYDGMIMSHMRNEDDDAIETSIQELLKQGEFCNVHIAHLKVVYGKGQDRAQQVLKLIHQKRDSRYSITADIYPYSASYTGIGIVFPKWAKAPNNYESVKTNRRAELLQFLRQKVTARNGPEATLLGTQPYAGKTLAELSEEKGKAFENVLLEDIGPEGASGAYFVMNDELQERLVQDPKIMIGSDGSPTMRHPRGYGSFAKIIETYVIEKSLFPLTEAIRKMTSLPAQTLGLTDRGFIKPGYKADLVIFHPENIKANATFVDPHLLAEGFDYVLVNGQLAFKKGKNLDAKSGSLLRKKISN